MGGGGGGVGGGGGGGGGVIRPLSSCTCQERLVRQWPGALWGCEGGLSPVEEVPGIPGQGSHQPGPHSAGVRPWPP